MLSRISSSMFSTKKLLFVLILVLLSLSLIAGAYVGVPPQATPTNTQTEEFTTIDIGNNTTIDIEVKGNTTSLSFEDGSQVVVSSYSANTTVEIYDSLTTEIYTRLIILPSVPLLPPIQPLKPLEFTDIPLEGAGMKLQEVNRSSGEDVIQTEMVQMSLTSNDPILPSMVQVTNTENNPDGTTDFSYFLHLHNDSYSEFQFYAGEMPSGPSDLPMGTLFQGSSDKPTADHFGPYNFGIYDHRPGSLVTTEFVVEHQDSLSGIDSFFDVFYDIDGQQQHQLSGEVDPDAPSTLSYMNITGDMPQNAFVDPGSEPFTARWPNTVVDDPAVPFEFLDVVITNEFVGFTFDFYEMMLYWDKLIINYYTGDGTYVPIVIYFIVYEVVIIYEYITIVVYVEIIELVVVIIIYEIIKIEVYITYIVLIIEIIEIIVVEIIIYVINIEIIMIQINITIINVFILQIIFNINININIVILPVWIIFIPVPIFVPVFVPVFIPVPTPIPYIIPHTDVDLANQTLDEPSNELRVSYRVQDEYNRPVTGAQVNVSLTEGGATTVYQATEDPITAGLYHATLPYAPNGTLFIEAWPLFRPKGELLYSQQLIQSPPSPVTTTVTSTDTASSPLLTHPTFVLIFLVATGFTVRNRRRNKQQIH